MLSRDTLSQEHAELTALADGILAELSVPAPDYAKLGALRWKLSRLLLVHLAKEDKLLYPALARTGTPSASALSRRFADEMGGLAVAFTEYVQDWPIQRALVDWAGFVASTRAVLDSLHQRIRREEAELYPLMR